MWWRSGWIRGVQVCVAGAGVLLAADVHADSLSFEAEATSVVLPDGPSSIGGVIGSFEGGGYRGDVRLALPFPLPDGAGGPMPQLALRYSSEGGQGPVGLGWSVAMPRICRSTRDGVVPEGPVESVALEMFDGPASGELVLVEGEWQPRNDAVSVRVRRQGNGWLVLTPDGANHEYGLQSTSRTGVDASWAEGSSCWYLERSVDPRGRRLEYTWRAGATADGGTLVPDRVRWAFGASGSFRELAFVWGGRDDLHTTHLYGHRQSWTDLLTSVDVRYVDAAGAAQPLYAATLSYGQGVRGARLVSVAFRGSDGTTLPEHRFEWGPEELRMQSPTRLDTNWALDSGRQSLMDVDGDGLVDLLELSSDSWRWRRNAGSGEIFGTSRPVEGLTSVDPTAGWRVADLNADGRRDVVSFARDDVRWFANESVAGSAAFGDGESTGLTVAAGFGPTSTRFGDINGDGTLDALTESGGRLVAALGVATDVRGAPRFGALRYPEQGSGIEGLERVELSELQLADMDGDGVDDLVRLAGVAGSWSMTVYHGGPTGEFGRGRTMELPAALVSKSAPGQVRMLDVNGDGRPDVVWTAGTTVEAWVNERGEGFGASVLMLDPDRTSAAGEPSLTDLNGDGRLDVLVPVEDSRLAVYYAEPSSDAGLLVSHDNGMGARRELQWAMTDPRVSGAFPRQRPVLVEQRLQVVGSPAVVTRMTYEQGTWDPVRGRFAGFGRVRTTLVGEKETGTPEQRLVQDFYLGVGRESLGVRGAIGLSDELSPVVDVDGLAGRIRSQVHLGELDALLKEVRYGYEVQRLNDVQHRVVLRHEVSRQPEGLVTWQDDGTDGPGPRSADWGERVRWIHTRMDWEMTGQRIREHRRGYVQENGVELAGDEQCQEWDWRRHPDRPWYVVVEQRRLDGSCTTTEERTAQFYDGEAFVGLERGLFERGEPTRSARYFSQEDRWIDDVRLRRGARGEILERLDAGGHRVVTGWDAEHAAYAEREQLWLTEGEWGQADAAVPALIYEAQWEPTWGRMVQHRNAAQQTTRMEYDRLGRRVRQIQALGTAAQTTSETEYAFDATGGRIVETGYGLDPGNVILREVRRLDGAGRSLGTATELDDTRSVVRGVVSYSLTGAVLQTWNPHVMETAAFLAGERPAAGVPLVTYRYDELGRQIEQRLADGHQQRRRYLSGVTEYRDSSDVLGSAIWAQTPEVDFYDGLGQVTRHRQVMRDRLGTEQLNDATVTWDSLGRRAMLVRQHGQQRRWSYDSLGRLSAYSDGAESLEWAYDDSGRMLARSNSVGDVVMWSYDAVGRVRGVDQMLQGQDQPEAFARYEYDQSPDGGTWAMGRLSASVENGVRTELQYGFRGEVWQRARVVDGRRYEVSYQYDERLRPALTRYPGGVDVQRQWDRAGRPTAIPGYVDAVIYDSASLPVQYDLSNGVRVERSWDEQRRRTAFGLLGPQGRLMDVSRTFGQNQQPIQVQDRMNPDGDWSLSLEVTTDGRGRVLGVESPAFGAVSYELDAADRLLARVQADGSAPFHSPLQMMDMVYSGEFADAATSAGGREWVHDAAGRVVEHQHPDSRRVLAWDAMDHVTRIEDDRGWISEYRWSSAVERLTVEVRDTEGQLLERRTRLDQHSEEIVNADGAWLRVEVELHGEPVARRERLRAQGDWSNLASDPLPREPWRASSPLSNAGDSLQTGSDAEPGGDRTTPWSPRLALAAVWLGWALLHIARRWGRAFVWPSVGVLTQSRAGAGPRAVGGMLSVAALTGLAMLLSCGEPVDERTSPDEGIGRDVDTGPRTDEDHRFWMHSPWLGTVVMQTDSDGAVVGRAVVTPDGVLVRREFTPQTPWYERFGNADREEWTGYVFFGARFYDPDGARWLSRDPLAVTATLNLAHSNAYAYVGQQFMALLDVLGLGPSGPDFGSSVGLGFLGIDTYMASTGAKFGSNATGALVGVTAGVDRGLSMSNSGHSTVDSVAGGASSGIGMAFITIVSSSNPFTLVFVGADTVFTAVDKDLSLLDATSMGFALMGVGVSSAWNGDTSGLERLSAEAESSSNWLTGPAARFGANEVSEVLHEAEMDVRNMVYDIGQSYERAVDAGAEAIEESVSIMQSLFSW